jgi:IS5 family transposase
MRQERTVQATIFEVFARHEIGCALQAISQWLDGQRPLVSLVAGDLRRQGVRETGRRGLPAETVLRCALLNNGGSSRQHRADDLMSRTGITWRGEKPVQTERVRTGRSDTRRHRPCGDIAVSARGG